MTIGMLIGNVLIGLSKVIFKTMLKYFNQKGVKL